MTVLLGVEYALKYTPSDRRTERQRQERGREAERQRGREAERQRDRDRDAETQRHRETERQRGREVTALESYLHLLDRCCLPCQSPAAPDFRIGQPPPFPQIVFTWLVPAKHALLRRNFGGCTVTCSFTMANRGIPL